MCPARRVNKITCALALLLSSFLHLLVRALPSREAHRKLATSDGPAYTYRRTSDGTEPLGPSEWHLAYKNCDGDSQSPINLSASAQQWERLSFSLNPAGCDAKQLSFSPGDDFFKISLADCDEVPSVEFQNSKYEVLQVHIHSASEHTIGGAHHDAEIHLVHVKEGTDDELLVIGVLLDASEYGTNVVIEDLWDVVKVGQGWSGPEDSPVIELYDIIPAVLSFVTYSGSLTTPPCTEGVKWIVMTEPVMISEHQLEDYRHYVAGLDESVVNEFGDTNRPIQLRNGRELTYYRC